MNRNSKQISEIYHQDVFLFFKNYFKLGPLGFYYSLYFNYFFNVLDYYYNSQVLIFIFYYNCQEPTLTLSKFKISRAFFCTKARLPFKLDDKDFKNLSFMSIFFVFSSISPINFIASYDIWPLADWVWTQSSYKAA